jgi:hypothetical protein
MDRPEGYERRDIPGYEGLYQVDTEGEVHSLGRTTIAKDGVVMRFRPRKMKLSQYHPLGYLHVLLCSGDGARKTCRIHRLVAETFLGPCPAGMQVRHLNGIARDNRLSNLAYGTLKENADDRREHGTHPAGTKNPRSQFHSDQQIVDIRRRWREGEKRQALADEYGVSLATIKFIVYRKCWKHVP